MNNTKTKSVLYLLICILSFLFSITGLFLSTGLGISSHTMDSTITYGLTIIFMMWSQYGYNGYLKATSDTSEETIGEKNDNSVIMILSRVSLIGMVIAWTLLGSTVGVGLGCLVCVLQGAESLKDFAKNKQISEAIFAFTYIAILFMGVFFILF